MKDINTICLECGRKYGTKSKSIFGIWKADCSICGKKDVFCASAQHDFGVYNNPIEKDVDKIQDKI